MSHVFALLHGINGSHQEMKRLAGLLRPHGHVILPDLDGHGGRPMNERFSMARCAADLVRQLDDANIQRAILLGYSLGGYLALYMAHHHPQRVAGVVTLATKFIFDAHYDRITHYLADPERVLASQPELARQLESLHAPQDWRAVLKANRQLFADLCARPPLLPAELQAITAPSLVINGSRDPIVPLRESEQLAKLLPHGRGLYFHGPAHPIDAVPLDTLLPHLLNWTAQEIGGDHGAAEVSNLA